MPTYKISIHSHKHVTLGEDQDYLEKIVGRNIYREMAVDIENSRVYVVTELTEEEALLTALTYDCKVDKVENV